MRTILMCTLIAFLIVNLGYALNPEEVQNGHVYLFEDFNGGNTVKDSSQVGLAGNVIGNPEPVKGIIGQALEFNGSSDGIHIPDSNNINTGGPFTNRTILAIFNCTDVSKSSKQTIFEEGGRTRGLVVYVFEDELYVGGWNRAEYNWNGAWISSPIKSNRWYEVAMILRDTSGKVEADKFEMWLDGDLVDKADGGQLHGHSNDNSIGYTKENAVFHDDDGSGDGYYFEGMIDEVWILNSALTASDLGAIRSVEPVNKLAYTWGKIKVQK